MHTKYGEFLNDYRYLTENGHHITHDAKKADFIIINSCGYHKETRETSIALYKKYHEIKKQNSKIIMFGCLVKIDEELLRTLDLCPVNFDDGKILDGFFFNKKRFDEMTPRCDSDIRNKLCKTSGYLDFSHHSNFFLSRLFIPFPVK